MVRIRIARDTDCDGILALITELAREERGTGVNEEAVTTAIRSMLNNRTAAESFKRAFYTKLGYRVRDEFANLVKLLR